MKTPITYVGGKQSMLKFIRPFIPEHEVYGEPFCGGAAVFFDKDLASVNVINDLNNGLINFYRTLVNNFDELKAKIDETIHSRGLHEHAQYVYSNPAFFSNVDFAWSVWVLSKLSFASKLDGSFGYDKEKPTVAKKIQSGKENISIDLKTKLEYATIEKDDAFKIIERYDCKNAWFFVDPPYINSRNVHYSSMFNEQGLNELLLLLSKIKGKFMLTMYPNDAIKKSADKYSWNIEVVKRNIAISNPKSRRQQEEWLVMNY